jgi:hypothetical protein
MRLQMADGGFEMQALRCPGWLNPAQAARGYAHA